jgi:hypothetical protein
MKTTRILVLFSLLFFAFSAFSQTVYEWYQDGKVVFQLKSNVGATIKSKDKQVNYESIDFLNRLKNKYGIIGVTQLHPEHPDLLLRSTYQIDFTNIELVEDLIKDVASNNIIEYAEKKELHKNFLTPNDQYFINHASNGQWSLFRINAQQAWDISTGSANIIVAVTDNAINVDHPDLTNKMVAGYDAPTGGNNPRPCGSNNGFHGSHVSGIVGAQTNNTIGIASIGFNVSVMPIKIGNCNGSLTHGYEGITWAAQNGAHVINMSWGGAGFSNYGQNVCNSAYNMGAILVAAAGNDNTNQQFYPAAYNNVIAVASTTTNDAKSSFSQYGTWINISAPGSSILSCNQNTGYQVTQGTSMASPLVAGLLGLMKSHAPNATQQDLINCLYSSADNINAVNPSYIGQLGAGRINAHQAMICASSFSFQRDAAITAIISPAATVCGTSFTPQVTLRNFGSNTLTSVTITYNWNGTPATFNWTGNLPTGQTTNVTLPVQNGANGTYTFTAATSMPNGQSDQNPSNDASSIQFTADPNGQTVTLTVITDCYGDEITWNVQNALGNTVASGGPYVNNVNGNTNNHSFCLPVGCYTFNIADSYGDGMYGAQWQNCAINGNYYMVDGSGNTLFQMTAPNANFGSGTSHNFCIIAPSVMNDAGISQVISPSGIGCNSSLIPVVQLRNYGNNALTSATINYQITGGTPQTFNWTGNLASGQTTNVTLPSVTASSGLNTFTAYTTQPNGTADDDTSNDSDQSVVTVYTSALPLPFTETFSNNPFSNGTWTIENPDNDITWEIVTVAGTSPGTNAAKMDFYQYTQAAQRDAMISPKLNFNGYTTINMTFEHAYRRFDQSSSDSLIIYVSTDCGSTYTRVVAYGENGTGTFATATTSNQAFNPQNSNEWCMGTVGANCFSVNLDAFIGNEVLIKFEAFNAGTTGNNLYVDNINITGVPAPNPPPTAGFSSNTNSICVGQTVNFTDQSTPSITAWNWSFPGGTPATSTVQNPTVTYNTAGIYNVTLQVTNANGTNSITQNNYVTVVALPNVVATASSNAICDGESVNLNATGANTYSWNNGLGAGASHTVSPTSNTTYTVTGTGTGGCVNTAQVTVTVNPLPATPVITQNGNSLSVNVPGGSTVQWYYEGNPIPGGNTASITMNGDGEYTAVITSGAGCEASASGEYQAPTSVNEFSSMTYKIYPMPTSGQFTLEIYKLSSSLNVRLTDVLGKELVMYNFSQPSSQQILQFDISDKATGVYFIIMESPEGRITEKVILTR